MNNPATEAPGISDARRKKILKRISTARLVVNSYCRFFAHLVGKTTVVIAEPHHGVPTAAVSPDGYVFFNPDFVEKLSDAELAGLVIHETLHPALLCWKRQGSRKAMLSIGGQVVSAWNLAHDLSFNPEIVEMANACRSKGKIKLPKFAALDAKYEGMSAEMIYDDLLKTAKKSPNLPPNCVGELGDGSGKPGGLPGEGKPGDGIGDDLRSDLSQSEVGKRAARGDKAAKQKIQNDWRVSVIAAAYAHERKHGRGSLPAGIAKMVAELQECKIDWRDVLSQWLGENGNRQDITWRRPRRRFDPNVLYLPSFQKFGVDDVVILWDTSGSMNGRETEILSEIQGICEDLGLRLVIICIDTAIHSITRDVQKAEDMIGNIKGGGGSDFTPAFDHLEEECFEGVVVAFTDGYIGVPSTKPPLIRDVLWCIKPSKEGGWGDVDPTDGKWGQVLLMEDQR
jgi:predicted metal-dependent peptidase